ncbi:MAG: glucosidase [Myxococcales bacterium]|nr:glucosidase [Myxococcales bacterium]
MTPPARPARAATAEQRRLEDSEARRADWKHWGPYLAERAWGTVREDYSPDGEAWRAFPHEHARSRAYRWNEDGLAGVCNRFQNACLAVALWNGQDRMLKERLFGLDGDQGNHGEDVKEYYWYLDSTPTHSYLKMLYRYPQVAYPYEALVRESERRNRHDPEYELTDALREAFAAGRYFDVYVEYAKASEEDVLCRITVHNRGPEAAPVHVLPHLWLRNTWAWSDRPDPRRPPPRLRAAPQGKGGGAVELTDRHLGKRWWWVEGVAPSDVLFTENDSNAELLFDAPSRTPYVKDAFHRYLVDGERSAVNPAREGTKACAVREAMVPPGGTFVVRHRLADVPHAAPFADFDAVFAERVAEADAFYDAVHAPHLDDDARQVQREALAGLMWTKQFFHYGVDLWLRGDPAPPKPPPARKQGRNAGWEHLYALDVHAMPDAWEYPWFAAWDTAFHTLPIALVDPEWAKRQLILLLREWYMHPNGQIPAYEWNFGDVNPPVHAWAAWRVYKIDRNLTGRADTDFLERVFQKLLINFTWWVNRKDRDGRNIFQGGFLGLDNIGVFDRSKPLPTGGHIEQADGTAWMGMYCLNMLAIALELASTRPAYEDVATKFFEHFISIAHAIDDMSGEGVSLWDTRDGFYYDVLHLPDGRHKHLRIRSFVGLIPLFAVETIEPELLDRLPRFKARMEWFVKYRPHLVRDIASLTAPGEHGRRLLSILDRQKLMRVLPQVFDEAHFLSDYGLRSLSRWHAEHPYVWWGDHENHAVAYEPGESTSWMFGGNSNWRGPVWFPVNYLMVESLEKYAHYYGDALKVHVPGAPGVEDDRRLTLAEAAADLGQRLCRLFLPDADGRRPALGPDPLFRDDPAWRRHPLFYEYFHGDTGAGLGASHQTGWTALVAKLLQRYAPR